MTQTLIVPGLDGSPAPHWQHWWSVTEADAQMVDLSDPSRPVPAVWEYELAQAIVAAPDSILVGHSLGAVLIARLLTRYPDLPVRAALLVAPAETRGSDRIGQFGPIPERLLPVPSTVVASRNDPWMSLGRASQLASAWGARLVDLGEAGHINRASGFGPWPEGKVLRDALILRSARAPFLAVPQAAWRAI
ncbi:RBBP9/YdeN family alpha/beta hydrolase [Xinfangfangia pollutisoli]|uniref:RBBP9/YdeN family alpha/beta hydrolase n=1 Tax=Xinfangfangia pollutisoli TaxID=2865960 RepID=UPI001CD64F5E|nr:alpha/beta hydrolase [Xinfangfangia pollutisoli]